MASIGQLLMAGQGAASREDIRLADIKEKNRREKAGIWGGWGRAGGFGASFLATMGMTNPITAAVLTGMGALAGRSAGRALGGGLERDADKSLDTDFYQGAQRDFKSEIGDYQQGMRNRMVMDTGRDIFSAYNLNKLRDPLARSTGIGGESYGQRVTEQGLRDNPWLTQSDDDFWASIGDDALAGTSTSAASSPIEDSLLNLVGSGPPPAVTKDFSRLGLPVGGTAPSNVAPVTSGMNVNPIGGMDPYQQYGVTSYSNRYGTDPNINPMTGQPYN